MWDWAGICNVILVLAILLQTDYNMTHVCHAPPGLELQGVKVQIALLLITVLEKKIFVYFFRF